MAAILPLDEDKETRRRMAGDPNTSGRDLAQLAKDEDLWVRVCVAKNPSTPAEILEQLELEGKMSQYVVEFIDDLWYLYGRDCEWQEYVCPEGDFGEYVVLTGNDRMYEIEDAKWWEEAKDVADALGDSNTADEFVEDYTRFYGGVPADKLREVYAEYTTWNGYVDDTEFITRVAQIIHPELNLKYAIITGSLQGDWQGAIYNSTVIDFNTLADFYTGDVMEMRLYELEPGDFEDFEEPDDIDLQEIVLDKDNIACTTITSTQYWEMRNEGLDKSIARLFDIPEGSFEVLD